MTNGRIVHNLLICYDVSYEQLVGRTKMKNLYKNEQTGRSMVEMLGVLAIIGVLSIGGIAGYSKAMTKYKVSKALDQISMILMNVRTVYASAPNYSGLNTGAAIGLGIFPGDMFTDAANMTATTLKHPFGDSIAISVAASNLNFTLTFDSLPADVCATLASTDWGVENFVKVKVGKTEIDYPIVPSTVGDACTATTYGAKTTVVWTFK